MTKKANVTFEEASHCPKCGEAGKETVVTPNAQGKVHTIICQNERCKWYSTGWVVMVLKDGSIPLRDKEQPKQFEAFTASQENAAKSMLQRIAMETGVRYNG